MERVGDYWWGWGWTWVEIGCFTSCCVSLSPLVWWDFKPLVFSGLCLQFDWRRAGRCSVRDGQLAVVRTCCPLPPHPSLREWNRPVLLLAFPSSESEAVVLKCGFWIVDQKMRPEVHAEVRIGLHSCSCCQDELSLPGPSWAVARKARAHRSCDSTPSTGIRVTRIPSLFSASYAHSLGPVVFGEILSLSFTLLAPVLYHPTPTEWNSLWLFAGS